MIEINARLINGSAFLAGEIVECCITFSNPQVPNHKKSHSNSDVLEILALASAQIHCQCTTNYKMILNGQKLATETSLTSADTSFAPYKGETGHVVLSTKPKILFCDLRLAMGESKSFLYKETLPSEVPPSYRGQAVKYSYKITIGTQRVNSPIKLLRVPLRVLVVSGVSDSSACNDSEDLMPTNPFLETQQKDSPLEITLQLLQHINLILTLLEINSDAESGVTFMKNITARRSPNFYNITNVHGKVVRFCLFKQAYKLGEDIVGTFDFTDATVPCVQYSVTLQSEEEIQSDYKRSPKQGPSVISYSKQHEVCYSWKYLQLILPIPFHITPAFATDLVKLQWRLHFEFVTTLTPNTYHQSNIDLEDKTWHGPSPLNIETMIWNLPIKIFPTNPQHITQGLQAQSKYSLII